MGIKHYIENNATNFSIQDYHKISEFLAKVIDDNIDNIDKIKRKIICIKNNGHYDKETATEDVAKMYYSIDNFNEKKYAPYWSFDVVEKIYNEYKDSVDILNVYNVYDFYVTLNMIKSDNYVLYKKRFSGYSENQLDKLFIEDAINWLNDADNPYGEHKIWGYLNAQDR